MNVSISSNNLLLVSSNVMQNIVLEQATTSVRNIYVSHSATQDISALRRVIEAQGGIVQGPYEISAPFVSAIDRVIESAQAVIVVFGTSTDPKDSANVLFELGMAIGLRKPALVIASSKAKLPHSIQGIAYLTSDVMDSPVVELGVKRFLNDAFTRSAVLPEIPSPSNTDGLPDRNAIRSLIPKIQACRHRSPDYVRIEELTRLVLVLSGIRTVEQVTEPSRVADFGVWSNMLHSSVLVAVKAGEFDLMGLQDTYHRLAEQVISTDSGIGLLLYLDITSRRFPKPKIWVPNILWFDLEDFANNLLTKSFADILIHQRNNIVHGRI